jgi:hypothetical protein
MLRYLENSGLRVHFDYEAWNGPRAPELDKECAARDFSADFDVVYGHFPITRYQGRQYRYIALLRDPYARALSNYKFHRAEAIRYPEQTDLYTRIGKWIGRGELSFREYVAIAPDMKTVFRDFMKYWSPERFTLIGTQERYSAFLGTLSRLLGVAFSGDVWERRSEDIPVDVPPADADRVRCLLEAEYKWYNAMMAKCLVDQPVRTQGILDRLHALGRVARRVV